MNIFHPWVNFLVNMDSLHGNVTNVCLNLFITGHLLFRTLICHHLFQKKFCNFGGHLIGLKTIENLHGDDQKMATAT